VGTLAPRERIGDACRFTGVRIPDDDDSRRASPRCRCRRRPATSPEQSSAKVWGSRRQVSVGVGTRSTPRSWRTRRSRRRPCSARIPHSPRSSLAPSDRAAFRAALTHRDALGPRDRALFDALAPSFGDPRTGPRASAASAPTSPRDRAMSGVECAGPTPGEAGPLPRVRSHVRARGRARTRDVAAHPVWSQISGESEIVRERHACSRTASRGDQKTSVAATSGPSSPPRRVTAQDGPASAAR